PRRWTPGPRRGSARRSACGNSPGRLDSAGYCQYSVRINAGGEMVKAARFEMRVDPEQLKQWKAVADAEGRSVGDWLARLADKEAGTALAILPEPQPGQFLVVKGEPQAI